MSMVRPASPAFSHANFCYHTHRDLNDGNVGMLVQLIGMRDNMACMGRQGTRTILGRLAPSRHMMWHLRMPPGMRSIWHCCESGCHDFLLSIARSWCSFRLAWMLWRRTALAGDCSCQTCITHADKHPIPSDAMPHQKTVSNFIGIYWLTQS